MKILLVEDEVNIAAFIRKGLEEAGNQVLSVPDGETALRHLTGGHGFQVVILDLMLPGISGWEVCRALRSERSDTTPILILSALSQTDDVVRGLEAGADDYLGKPFKITELMARLAALHRRSSGSVAPRRQLAFSSLRIDLDTREAWRGNDAIKLTVKEFDLLALFVAQPLKTLSRYDILEAIWGNDPDINTNIVDVYVNYLRKKLEKTGSPRLIHTVFGIGYILREDDAAE